MDKQQYHLGDIVRMKKQHPCGSSEWEILRVGMDFGFVESYNAIVRMAIDHERKILYLYWQYYKNGMTDDFTAEEIAEFKDTNELIRADSAEPKTIKYYRQQGFNMRGAKKFQGSRLAYTKKVKRFKKIICSNRPAVLYSQRAYLYKKNENT